MANEEHVEILRQGVDAWNEWRNKNPEQVPDLSQLNLGEINLPGIDLSKACLININFRNADLRRANLFAANLVGADLRQANLIEAELEEATLEWADCSEANLTKANLIQTDFFRATLNGTDFSEACLVEAVLSMAQLVQASFRQAQLNGASLIEANFKKANLYEADLSSVQALKTDFSKAQFTGVCIEDWNINSETKLDNIVCQYVYRKANQQERFPIDEDFDLGEFTRLFQKSLSFIDLIFRDGVDWQAFAFTFQNIKLKNKQADLAIQNIENRGDGTLVIRISVSPDSDKAEIHNEFRQGYEFAHKVLEEHYRSKLNSNNDQIVRYDAEVRRQQEYINSLFQLLNQTSQKLGEVPKLMADVSKSPSHQTTINAPNSSIGFIQSGDGTISHFSQNIGQNANEIIRILESLRSMTQNFPEAEREQALIHLDDLQSDIAQPEKRTPTRIKTRVIALWAIACTVAGVVAGATDFSNNVLELAEKLGVPIEFSQPQSTQQLPPSK